MNIWASYCNPDYYNMYFSFLKAKGINPEEVEKLKSQYCAYLQRIKQSCFASELQEITTREEFANKINEIFNVKWEGKIAYSSMPSHYLRYLDFLDTIQALHQDFINENEKNRLINTDFDIPIPQLSHYEEEYMVEGKLVALANPQLLHILKEYIETRGITPKKLTLICKDFYEGLLPDMDSDDYAELIKMLWSRTRQVKKGGRRNKILITFPDGESGEYLVLDGTLRVIEYYGFDDVLKLKTQLRGANLIVKYVPFGLEKIYREIGSAQYIRFDGNYKDYLNALRAINIHFGSKLKIELT